jgi:hypothetical protein
MKKAMALSLDQGPLDGALPMDGFRFILELLNKVPARQRGAVLVVFIIASAILCGWTVCNVTWHLANREQRELEMAAVETPAEADRLPNVRVLMAMHDLENRLGGVEPALQLQSAENAQLAAQFQAKQQQVETLEREKAALAEERDSRKRDVQEIQQQLLAVRSELNRARWEGQRHVVQQVLGTVQPSNPDVASGLAEPRLAADASPAEHPIATSSPTSVPTWATPDEEEVVARRVVRQSSPRSSYLVFNGMRSLSSPPPVDTVRAIGPRPMSAAERENIEFFRRRMRDPVAWQIHALEVSAGYPPRNR